MSIDPALALALRLAAALLFGAAAIHKLRGFADFRATLESYRVVPEIMLLPVAFLVPVLEGALALGCLAPVDLVSRSACITGSLLLGVYGFSIAINLARGRRDLDCGCGGPAGGQRISSGLVARNLVLMALLAVAALPSGARSLVWLDYVTALSLAAFLSFSYATVDWVVARAGLPRAELVL